LLALFFIKNVLDKECFDIFYFSQSSCSSASPSFVSKDFLCSEVDRVFDKVVEDLISEAATIVASESD